MNTIAILTLLPCLLPTVYGRNYYVLTTFNHIQEYVLKMAQHPGLSSSRKSGAMQYNFCKSLLAAPVIEILSEDRNRPFERVDRGLHRIESNALTRLKEICMDPFTQQDKKVFVAEIEFKIRGYYCVDHDSRFTWLASYSTEQAVGFLFTTVPVNSIYAIIDHAIRMKSYTASMGSEFLDTIHKSDSTQKEPLCSLKKISQLRLCSICGDSLYRRIERGNDSIHHTTETEDPELFVDPYFNYFDDDHYGKPDNCPIITTCPIYRPGNCYIDVAALRCDISIKEKSYQFYIKRNLINDNNVYIFMDGTIKGETTINSIKNILAVDELLSDD